MTLCHYKIYNAALTTTKWIFLLPTHSSLDLSSFFFCWYIFSIAHVRHDDDDDKKEKKNHLYHPCTTTSNDEKAIFIELSVERQPAVMYVPRMRDNLYLCDVKKCVYITTRTMTMRRRLEWTMLTYIKYWVLWCAVHAWQWILNKAMCFFAVEFHDEASFSLTPAMSILVTNIKGFFFLPYLRFDSAGYQFVLFFHSSILQVTRHELMMMKMKENHIRNNT